MTCFWTGIISSLSIDDFAYIGIEHKPSIPDFIKILKNKNIKTNNLDWNKSKLTERQLEENLTHINDFPINTINSGYFCSTCEPFLLLISEIFSINIIHNFNGTIINYTNKKHSRKTVKYKSDTGHFWKD
tara:strand:+ start:317 stop:706 length:390 start_codon:yes stop_codon:yes gene_type:complete